MIPAPLLVRPDAGPCALPVTIAKLLTYLRFWRLLQSSTTMVGAPRYEISYRHPDTGRDRETRGCESSFDPASGSVRFSVGVEFPVNGKPGDDWRMCVAYEGNDTCHVWLWGNAGVIAHKERLYDNSVADAVCSLYEDAIEAHNDGIIPEN